MSKDGHPTHKDIQSFRENLQNAPLDEIDFRAELLVFRVLFLPTNLQRLANRFLRRPEPFSESTRVYSTTATRLETLQRMTSEERVLTIQQEGMFPY